MAQHTILMVDDDVDFRASVQMLLTARGYRVFTAENSTVGREILEREPIDLVLMDLMMDTRDEGLTAIQAIRGAGRTLPIMIVSGKTPGEHVDQDVIDQMVDAVGADLYMEKPVDPPAFLANIASLLG